MPIHSYLQRERVYILGREITSYILRERESELYIHIQREGGHISYERENNIYLERDYNDICKRGYRDHINSITHTSYGRLILSMHPHSQNTQPYSANMDASRKSEHTHHQNTSNDSHEHNPPRLQRSCHPQGPLPSFPSCLHLTAENAEM